MNDRKMIKEMITLFSILFILSIGGLIFSLHQEHLINKASKMIENGETISEIVGKIKYLEEPAKNSETLMITACKTNNTLALQDLIFAGIDPNETKKGYERPLEMLCRNQDKASVENINLMLDHGANPNYYSYTPPLFIITERYKWMSEKEKDEADRVLISLIDHGANAQYNGNTILHEAARNKRTNVFDYLLTRPEIAVFLETKNEDGKTPYDLAVSSAARDIQKTIRDIEMEKSKAEWEKEHQEENELFGNLD